MKCTALNDCRWTKKTLKFVVVNVCRIIILIFLSGKDVDLSHPYFIFNTSSTVIVQARKQKSEKTHLEKNIS